MPPNRKAPERGEGKRKAFPRPSGQILRSIPASALGFAADALILFFLVEVCGIHYLLSNAASFVLGSTLVYFLNRSWVFPLRSGRGKAVEYALFLLLAAIGLGFNSLLLWALTDGLRLWYMASKVAAAVIVFFYNFACRKFIVFRAGG